jgi:hypothetical protein
MLIMRIGLKKRCLTINENMSLLAVSSCCMAKIRVEYALNFGGMIDGLK